MDVLNREMERKRKALQEAKQKRMMMIEQSESNKEQQKVRRYMKASEVRRILDEEIAEEEDKRKKKRSAISSSSNKNHAVDDYVDDVTNHEPENDDDKVNDAVLVHTSKKRRFNDNTAAERSNDRHGNSQENNNDAAESDVVGTDQQTHRTLLSLTNTTTTTTTLQSVQQELRLLGLPIIYFGETFDERIQRLQQAQQQKSIVQLQEREADEFRLGQGFGIRNTYLEKEQQQQQQQFTSFVAATDGNYAVATSSAERLEYPGNDTQKKRSKDGTKASTNKNNNNNADSNRNNDTTSQHDDDQQDPHKRVYKHFKGLLKQWELDLHNRAEDVKRSLAGRNEAKKVKQCKDYIRPLFQLCKRRQLEENMLNKLYAMVQFCEEGEFVKAHDAYMDIAIGRAAWPIGVTMVGIHARTGRAKIESSNVAHVMNSELQRKYLTSVKRLLTYEQKKRTDVDPSKKVL